ncbi:hypothetical protein NQ315_017384 [Exocentrus adspersus]|uniref:RNase H type-1 domain-containing protein n=1 Tax=Exocentrus adspersus TaxID=1586481 RepID=A0AAV8VKJ3_9CUCU|nr:hypothetical protein NQ315_017384 [Exocentrus adspersus]
MVLQLNFPSFIETGGPYLFMRKNALNVVTCSLPFWDSSRKRDKPIAPTSIVLRDSQAALHALKSPRITSQVLLECTNSLAELGQRNKVRLVWVPGHCGVTGNEEADALARKGSTDIFTGPEPAVGLPYSYPQGSIDNWTREKCQEDWSRGIGLRQARLLIKELGAAATRSLVSLNRANIKIITGLLTGHGRLNKHLNTIGLSPDSRCRLCRTSDEDSVHVLCHCPRVIVNRHKHFGAGYMAPEDIREIPVDKVRVALVCFNSPRAASTMGLQA